MKFEWVTSYYLIYFLAIFAIGMSFGFVLFLVNKNNWVEKAKLYIPPFIAFSCLGLALGIITSASRSAITDVVLPSLITLLGGLFTYLFLNEKFIKANRIQALIIICSISISVIYGVEIGSFYRAQFDDDSKAIDHWYEKQLEFYKTNIEMQRDSSLYFLKNE